jgi:hypothetical protein
MITDRVVTTPLSGKRSVPKSQDFITLDRLLDLFSPGKEAFGEENVFDSLNSILRRVLFISLNAFDVIDGWHTYSGFDRTKVS